LPSKQQRFSLLNKQPNSKIHEQAAQLQSAQQPAELLYTEPALAVQLQDAEFPE
jgi:hypothetical protein